MAGRLRLHDESADYRRYNQQGDGNDGPELILAIRPKLPAGHGVLQILPRRRADSDPSERHSREAANARISTRQSFKCPITRQQRRYFSIRLVAAGPDANSQQHHLSVSQRRDIPGIEVPIRKTL
jgi:hypothetical protein